LQVNRCTAGAAIAALLLTRRTNPLSMTVCAAIASPATFNGHIVQITATVESDGLHGSWLSDPSCNGAIVIGWPEAARKNPRIEQLRSVLFRSVPPGTLDKDVRATLTGVYRWRADARPPRVIDITDVRDLSVRPVHTTAVSERRESSAPH
jgi:hypothetical protein